MKKTSFGIFCCIAVLSMGCRPKSGSKPMSITNRDGELIKQAMITYLSNYSEDPYIVFLDEISKNKAVINNYGFLTIGPWVYNESWYNERKSYG